MWLGCLLKLEFLFMPNLDDTSSILIGETTYKNSEQLSVMSYLKYILKSAFEFAHFAHCCSLSIKATCTLILSCQNLQVFHLNSYGLGNMGLFDENWYQTYTLRQSFISSFLLSLPGYYYLYVWATLLQLCNILPFCSGFA